MREYRRKCVICGDDFTAVGKAHQRIVCGDKCRDERKRQQERSKNKLPLFPTCVVCGITFERKNSAKTCSVECSNKRNADNRARYSGNPAMCSDGCGRVVGSKGAHGRCSSCNQARKRKAFVAEKNPCEVEGCANFRRIPGNPYCDMHRSRVRKYGEPGPVGRVQRKRGTGTITKSGYVVVGRNKRIKGEHVFVMEEILGRPVEPFENVHHLNGIRNDNRPENLQLWCTPQPAGQRPEDLAAWVVEHYRELVIAELENTDQLRLAV